MGGSGPLVRAIGPLTVFAALGGPVQKIQEFEGSADSAITNGLAPELQPGARERWLLRPAALAFPVYHFRSLSKAAASSFKILGAETAFLRGDTAQSRRALIDIAAGRRFAAPFDITFDALYPEAWLLSEMGDERAAIAWLDPSLSTLPYGAPQGFIDPANAGPLVRAMALRAELAARVGDGISAAQWARAVLILWGGSDSFLQSTVQRMARLAESHIRPSN